MKWTEERIINFIEENNYSFIKFVEYKGVNSRIVVQCDLKHKEYEVSFNNFKNGKRCPVCKSIKSSECQGYTFHEIVENIESYGFKVLSKKEDFINSHSTIKICCNNGHIQNVTFANFRRRKEKCTECSNRNNKEYQEVKEYIESFGCKLISKEYKNNSEKLKIKCVCGKEMFKSFDEFRRLKNKCCSICSGYRISIDDIRSYLSNYDLMLISDIYTSRDINLKVKCLKCGEIFSRSWSNLQSSHLCPHCSRIKSKGENKVCKVLKRYHIFFKQEFLFDGCKNYRTLPFDFYLPQFNIAIEYDGIEHYKLGHFDMTLLDLMNRKRLDNIKTQYCNDNNIKLIRIPYWELDNIENIICQELNLNKHE